MLVVVDFGDRLFYQGIQLGLFERKGLLSEVEDDPLPSFGRDSREVDHVSTSFDVTEGSAERAAVAPKVDRLAIEVNKSPYNIAY